MFGQWTTSNREPLFFLIVSADGSIKTERNKGIPAGDSTWPDEFGASMVTERARAFGFADQHFLDRYQSAMRRANLVLRRAERNKRGSAVQQRYLPVEDIRVWLGDVSRSTLYAMWDEGRLPAAIKIGGRTVMDLTVLEQWAKWGCPDRSEFEARMELERWEPPKRGRPRKRKGAR